MHPNITPAWAARFALIDLAGGPSLPLLDQLTLAQCFKISVNFLAYLFGPLYYLRLGLWRQAITLTALSTIGIASATALGVPLAYAAGIIPAVFGLRVNIDFYKSRILRNAAWL